VSRGRIQIRRELHAPAATIFALLTDLERTPEWDRRVLKVTQMTRGPLRPGVILRSTLVVDGEMTYLDDEITDFEPPTRLGLRSIQGNTNAVSYVLAESGDAHLTTVDVSLAYDLPDPPSGVNLDDSALRSTIANALAEVLDLLRERVEGVAPN
jgi:uncharacterized protein YndB with AHSA1/START domain